MSSLLYYSISSDLTKDEIIEINKQVDNNREAVYLFFRISYATSEQALRDACQRIQEACAALSPADAAAA